MKCFVRCRWWKQCGRSSFLKWPGCWMSIYVDSLLNYRITITIFFLSLQDDDTICILICSIQYESRIHYAVMSTAGHEISLKSKSLLFIQSGRHVTVGNLINADMILQTDCSAVQQFTINCKTQVLHGVEPGWGQNQTVVRYKQTSPGVQTRNLRSNCWTNAC